MCNLSESIYEDGYEKGKMDEIENTKRESYRADTKLARGDCMRWHRGCY